MVLKRRLLLVAGIFVVIVAGSVALWRYVDYRYTKSFSPEDEVVYHRGDLKVSILYNRPYKKGRLIFGGLVPYGKVWRTGANEATIFQTNKDLMIEGKRLPAGKYTLWTIPREDSWTVIFNSETGQWGINSEGEANHNPSMDVLDVDLPTVKQGKEFEQFTIMFEDVGSDAEMILIWNTTLVTVPFSY